MQVAVNRMMMDDIDEVMEIEHASFTLPWSRDSFEQEISNNPHAFYVVARVDSKIVGYGGIWVVLDEGHVTNIAVHPRFRRLGIGSAMLSEILAYALSQKVVFLTLEVRETNIAAQKLYSSFNFCIVGRRKKYYTDNNEDAFIMNVEL